MSDNAPQPLDAGDVILINSPLHERFSEASFVGQLQEWARFDAALYQQLEDAMLDLDALHPDNAPFLVDFHVIYARVVLLLHAHLMPNDGYRVEGLSDDEVDDLGRRWDWLFQCWFAGELPDLSRCVDPAQLGKQGAA